MGLFGTKGVFGGTGKITKTIGSFIPGIGDADAAADANEINIEQADVNRRFQERMSNTAYQRAMTDMKSAGLNPTLAYMQGGASVPSGSQATVTPVARTALADFAMKGAGLYLENKQKATALQQQATVNDSTVKLNASTAAKNIADAEKTRSETKGLGRKEEEGKLWKKFYKGVNNMLDNSAKDAQLTYKTMIKPMIKKFGQGSEIKKLGPASKEESALIKGAYKSSAKP